MRAPGHFFCISCVLLLPLQAYKLSGPGSVPLLDLLRRNPQQSAGLGTLMTECGLGEMQKFGSIE